MPGRYLLSDLVCAALLTTLAVVIVSVFISPSLPSIFIVMACVMGFTLSIISVVLGGNRARKRWQRLVFLVSGCLVGFILSGVFWLLILLPMQKSAHRNMFEREFRAMSVFTQIAMAQGRYRGFHGILGADLSEIGLSKTAAVDIPMYSIRIIRRDSPDAYRVLAIPDTNKLRALVCVPGGDVWAKEMPQNVDALLCEAILDSDDMRRMGWVPIASSVGGWYRVEGQ